MPHIPISDCDICKHLSSHNYADLRNGPVPPNLAAVIGDSATKHLAEQFIQCRICGTLYLFNYECGFGENDVSLRRATPTEAGMETDVARCQQDLKSAHDDTRGYAAQCLVEHFLKNRNSARVDTLLNSSDEVIKSFAQASQRFHFLQQTLTSDR